MKLLQPFLIAVQFLTRLPLNLHGAPSERDIGRSVLCYPVVGALIGSLLAAIAIACHGHIATMPAAAILLVVWVLASGGLHLDGLADSADAWAGGRGDRERMLAIMKDPYCGPLGVTSLIVVLLLKFSALTVLATHGNPWLLILAPLLGRTTLLPLFITTAYVRPGGLGSAMHAHLPHKTAALIVLLACGSVVTFYGMTGTQAILAGLVMFLLLRRMMLRHIGGMTGDTAGALVELVEVAVAMMMASMP